MRVWGGIILGVALVFLLNIGYGEYQKYKIVSSIRNIGSSSSGSYKHQGISPSDFDILSFNIKWENGRLRAYGEIKNNGTKSGGPEVEVIARDENDQLVDSKKFWPNSTNNIPPGSTCGIAYSITRDTRAKKAEIKVVGVDVWH